jgi:hypothetical protein
MTSREQGGAEEEAAILLDQVMRGERTVVFPPGTLAASFLVPFFAVGATSAAMAIGLAVSRSFAALVGSAAAAITLTSVLIVGHILVVRGYPLHRARMRSYVRIIGGFAATGGAIAAVTSASAPWILTPVALVSLIVCDLILGSRSYLAFSAFLSLKRQYREDQRAARERVLGRAPRNIGR